MIFTTVNNIFLVFWVTKAWILSKTLPQNKFVYELTFLEKSEKGEFVQHRTYFYDIDDVISEIKCTNSDVFDMNGSYVRKFSVGKYGEENRFVASCSDVSRENFEDFIDRHAK